MASTETFDVVVIGGGPSGATAARDLAARGRAVLLLDKEGRIKPCGGAVPPRLVREFEIPERLLVAKVSGARIVSPRDRRVDMPIEGGYVGMVDRDVFDAWLRERAGDAGAQRRTGKFTRLSRDADGVSRIHYEENGEAECEVRARAVIGADGANSAVARQGFGSAARVPFVAAYHEIIRAPAVSTPGGYDRTRCDVFYNGALSPDFYAWIFPHGGHASIGVGSARKGFSLRAAVTALRESTGLAGAETVRREGAPIPLHPLARWDNGHDLVLAGDAAGVVAPASGEGIYYAMAGGRFAADAADAMLATGDPRALAQARKRFMKAHGQVFWILGVMQRYWYSSDARRERFVRICGDRDVQQLTWDAYMNKELVRARPLAHARIFLKNIAHLTGLAPA